ncbi:MAG: TRAP transporter small permease subunit [Burkholderiales bacterium]|nr:TRAP transporter small permease subunit [Burkholderiales bacterium]
MSGNANSRALILQRHRHLKWRAFDRLEATLMVLCGACIAMFTLAVFCDVVTRTLGSPWLWLQQVTTAFFAWGVFLGMAVATRHGFEGPEDRDDLPAQVATE